MNKAFTLIELLVVVLIIGILSAIALPQYTKAVEKARLAEAMTNIKAIDTAVKEAMLTNGGTFPSGTKFKDIMSSVGLSGGTWNNTGNTYTTKNFEYSGGVEATDHSDYSVDDQFGLYIYRNNETYRIEVHFGPGGIFDKTCYADGENSDPAICATLVGMGFYNGSSGEH